MSTQTIGHPPTQATSSESAPFANHIIPSPVFKKEFNKHPFLFQHNLADHPLFSLSRLYDLALETREKRPQELYYDTGHNVPVGQRWSEMGARPPIEEAFDRIDDAGSWISIHQAQRDPAYAQVFYECMRELESQTGQDFKKLMRVEDALIFITSPNRTTTYHIDRECNFLLQVSGSKTIYMFDQRDKEVLPETEIEKFWSVDNNAATYKPQLQDRSTPYRLVPGNGIHIPINDPHWLQNDNNVSISLSVNFTMKDKERANVYRANYLLRKAGLQPAPPFKSALKDGIKNAAMTASYMPARSLKRTLRRLRGQESRTT
jgi:hypothetical protein